MGGHTACRPIVVRVLKSGGIEGFYQATSGPTQKLHSFLAWLAARCRGAARRLLPRMSSTPKRSPRMTRDDTRPTALRTAPGPDALGPGDRVPDAAFRLRRGPDWVETSSADIFGGRNVIVFSLPGA